MLSDAINLKDFLINNNNNNSEQDLYKIQHFNNASLEMT